MMFAVQFVEFCLTVLDLRQCLAVDS